MQIYNINFKSAIDLKSILNYILFYPWVFAVFYVNQLILLFKG